jgi:drug/metabolite transporter (DMT)-like permease
MSARTAATAIRPGLMPLAIGWAAILLWGGSPIATRFAVLGIEPVAVGILRTILAALLALPLAILLKLPYPRGREAWVLLIGAALASYVLFPILFSVGLRHTTASHAALIHASTPLFTGIIAAALERSWPRGWWWTGVAVALIGEALLIGLGRGFDEPGVTLYGDLVVFIACVAVAFGYVAGGSLSRTLGSLAVTLWGVALAALIIAPGLLVVPVSGLLDAPASALGGLAFLVLISSVIGYVAWNWALAHGGIGRTGVLMFAQPILSVILAVLLLGESVTLSIGVPAAIILAGVAIARRG